MLVFEKQFERSGDGYLYHPDLRGARFVSQAEFDAMRVTHRRSVRWAFVVMAGMMVGGGLLGAVVGLPEAAPMAFAMAGVALGVGMIMRATYAPMRLLKDREVVAPPRPIADRRRVARGMLSWPLLGVGTALFGAMLATSLTHREATFGWWMTTVFEGALLTGYLWVGVRKFRDRRPGG